MNYDEIPAGEEMDAAVTHAFLEPKPEATKTYRQMDMEDAGKPDGGNYTCWTVYSPKGFWKIDIDISGVARSGNIDFTPDWSPMFEPSTDIAAAWQVVEALIEQDFNVTIETEGKRFEVWVSMWTAGHVGRADTTQLAICRAALKAKQGLLGLPSTEVERPREVIV